MNRKQRRANKAHSGAKSPAADLFARAAQSHREGRLDEAEHFYRQVLASDSGHADSLHRLGVIAYQRNDHGQAEALLRRAIAQKPAVAAYHSHLGLALDAQGRLEEALACCRTALERDGDLADLHNNMGVLLMRLARPGEAVVSYRKAIALAPGLAELHNNLGNALLALDQVREAGDSYRKAVTLAPGLADAHANLGGVLQALGDPAQAISHFRRALEIAPGQADVLAGLALAYLAQADHRAAMDAILSSLALEETTHARRVFVQCVQDLHFVEDAGVLSALLSRALREGWDRPDDLAPACAAAILRAPGIAALMAQIQDGGLLDGDGLAVLAQDQLLQALLIRAPNLDIGLERLLTLARRALLDRAMAAAEDNGILEFHAALAQQCFINEYVFCLDDGELAQAGQLRDALLAALENNEPAPSSWVAAVGSYFPLESVSPALTNRTWPPAISALLAQQILEPEEERRLQAGIPRLTSVLDPVSRLVQAQYEENPYPRWVAAGSCDAPQELVSHLRRKFPHAALAADAPRGPAEILVAGCGTGRNAIETALRFKGARVLAVDLSLASLGHAARKSRGLAAIEYAQADLLELGSAFESSGRRFDLIEAVGVLHHLADTYAGWRVLLSLLKPGGFMLVGLYSPLARRNLAALRRAAEDFGVAAGDIRRARQYLLENSDLAYAASHPDFFSISTCRDLLFHVQEQTLSLRDIDAFLRGNGLTFLGFSIEEAVLSAYRQRYPHDPSATDLQSWQAFETDNPDSFSGMYQFWIQKAL